MVKSKVSDKRAEALSQLVDLPLSRYSTLGQDWKVSEENEFCAPLVKGRPDQMLVFDHRLRNGSISADVTILDSEIPGVGPPTMEAAFVIRYARPNSYIYAGLGAFQNKFFIGDCVPGPLWHRKGYAGDHSSIIKEKQYRLRLEFTGAQITLYENDVQQLAFVDESNQIGQCALRTWSTSACFENVCIRKKRPRAFVIMPFHAGLTFVHSVIERSIQAYDIDCVRADQISISRPVMEDVKTEIAEADLVVVDFTDKNPNVYYEAGLADAWKKDWIILAQSTDDLTFDVRHIRCILYSNRMGADKKLETDLHGALEALGYARACGETDSNTVS
jgi:hypothetical protein